VATDGEIADLAQRFFGDQLVLRFAAGAYARTGEDQRYEDVLAGHGLQELKIRRSVDPEDAGGTWVLIRTPDRDLERHVKALAKEPLVSSIELHGIGQVTECFE
jgi:hypothetical protein